MNQAQKEYNQAINRLGRLTSIFALIAMFSVPFGTAYYFNLPLDIGAGLKASIGLLAIFLPMAVVENLSFYPVLGAGGMYLSSITGNVLNMKLPVVIGGQKIAGVEPGSEEGDVVAVIAVGVSSLTTVTILFLGMFLIGQWVVPILEHELFKPAFDHIMPALFGAVTVPQLLSHKKLSVVPIIASVSLFLLITPERWGNLQSYVLLGVMVLSVASAYGLYKKGKL